MLWIAPFEKDTDNAALEKRLWEAADQFRAADAIGRCNIPISRHRDRVLQIKHREDSLPPQGIGEEPNADRTNDIVVVSGKGRGGTASPQSTITLDPARQEIAVAAIRWSVQPFTPFSAANGDGC